MKKVSKMNRSQNGFSPKGQLSEEACMNMLRKIVQEKGDRRLDEISVIEKTIEYIEALSDTLKQAPRYK